MDYKDLFGENAEVVGEDVPDNNNTISKEDYMKYADWVMENCESNYQATILSILQTIAEGGNIDVSFILSMCTGFAAASIAEYLAAHPQQ